MPGSPAKPEYQVLARRYRPKTFLEVLGQDAVVTTLKNGMKQGRIAHAYLFSGPRGTGKTTLARLLSKTINCIKPTENWDPCNQCASCKEITQGTSLDVIEIDGASHRGIDDIRQINETVGYSSSFGKYKIYIIDEVHMLTKEAFNALLKTLEEPPASILFLFATTEPHKVPSTVLSRCQQFSLKHLRPALIIQKLEAIVKDLNREVEQEALRIVALRAEGGLRDAESLLDQLLSFHEGPISAANAAEAFGMLPHESFFQLDQAGKEGNLSFAFELSMQIFNEGKDPARFLEMLIEHFRNLVLVKLAGIQSSCLELTEELKGRYQQSAAGYHKNQLQTILELCLETAQTLRFASSPRITLESLLLKIFRSRTHVPIDQLVERLLDLEARVLSTNSAPLPPEVKKIPEAIPVSLPILPSIQEDPTPDPKELPKPQAKSETKPQPKQASNPPNISRCDTILQFAAIELEGKIIKK